MSLRCLFAAMIWLFLAMGAWAEEAVGTNASLALPPASVAGIGALLAEKAGLRAGDVLTQVDHLSIAGKTKAEVIKLLQGKPDTVVNLTYTREAGPPRYASLVRVSLSHFIN